MTPERIRGSAIAFGLSLLFYLTTPTYGQNLSIWQTDVCDKIFVDAPAGLEASIKVQAAGNEYESAMIGLKSEITIQDLRISVSNLVGISEKEVFQAENIRIREIGTIPILHNTPGAEKIYTRQAPCDIPEVLYERSTISLEANISTGIWLTFYIPKNTAPDIYSGALTFETKDFVKTLPIELEVFPFELSDVRHMYMTNWWFPDKIAQNHNVPFLSEDYWTILEQYLANMGEHRQNVLLLYWTNRGFVNSTRRADGTWKFDFSNLDRLIDLALKHQVLDRLELSHLGRIDRDNRVVRFNTLTVFDEAMNADVVLGVDEWLEPSVKALCNHLRERGLFERAMMHVADEPFLPDVVSWREASRRLRSIEPELNVIEAIETIQFEDRLDVWVPKLSHFDRWRDAFEARRDKGKFWYYICCHPTGETYPNRFMDLPGARIRELHWLNYSENLDGYLHWGYNYWPDAPFSSPIQAYAPGDTHVVYPGEGKPLDSIRWELQREGIEDFEYLKLLEEKTEKLKSQLDAEKAWFIDPKSRSMEIARQVVPSLSTATLDYNVINSSRNEIVNELKNILGPLQLVVQTFPAANAEVFMGPTLFEIYGHVTPGASVTINGEDIKVSEDGYFTKNTYAIQKGKYVVEVVATLEGHTAQTTRHYAIK